MSQILSPPSPSLFLFPILNFSDTNRYKNTSSEGSHHRSVDSSAPTILRSRVQIQSTTSMLLTSNLSLYWKKDENKIKIGRVWPLFDNTHLQHLSMALAPNQPPTKILILSTYTYTLFAVCLLHRHVGRYKLSQTHFLLPFLSILTLSLFLTHQPEPHTLSFSYINQNHPHTHIIILTVCLYL